MKPCNLAHSETPRPALTKVLVAEDDRISQIFMLTLMSHYGIETKVASNGRETLKLWHDWQPDLIFMDMRMPELNGLEVTQMIRQTIQTAATPLPTPIIIAVTASGFGEDRDKLLAAGCNDCLSKPLALDELNIILKNHFNLEETLT